MKLNDLAGTPPAAVLAQRARVRAIREGQPEDKPVAVPNPGPGAGPSTVASPATTTAVEQRCVLQFEAPLDFVRIEFSVAEVSVDDTSITVLFRSDFRLHLADLKPRLRLQVDGQIAHDVAYLGGAFQIPSLGLRGMTFVRILPEQ